MVLERMRGEIRAEYWVSCGVCNDTQFAEGGSKKAAVEQAKTRLGYKWTRQDGWVCPRCQEMATESEG